MNEQHQSSTYCDRPFNELHIEEDGSVTPCCVMPSNRFPMGKNIDDYLTGIELHTLKNDLLNGVKNKNCEYCWNNEAHNLKSHRVSDKRDSNLYSIHIRLNNVCNFKCRMCNPAFSSTWAQENKKHKYFVYEDNEIFKDTFDATAHYLFPLLKEKITEGSLKHLSISGGEPLITKAHFRLLNFLIDNRLTNISLSYSTNLSNLDYNGIDLLKLWSNFNSVTLEASVDGWGEEVEYSRTGFKREVFLNNFKRAFKYIKAINCVVNIYSVWTLPFIEKFRKYDINIIYSPCYLPTHLNPQILLEEDKLELKCLYADYPQLISLYENFIDKTPDLQYSKNDINRARKEMVDYNQLLDLYRNTKFFDTFPQYRKYENNYAKYL